MLAYATRRILMAIPTLWIALTMIFILVRVIPGDPTAAIMGDYISEEAVGIMKRQMGLDRPVVALKYCFHNYILCFIVNCLIRLRISSTVGIPPPGRP